MNTGFYCLSTLCFYLFFLFYNLLIISITFCDILDFLRNCAKKGGPDIRFCLILRYNRYES